MSVTIERVARVDAGEWDAVWSACDYATFFHSRHWLDLWTRYKVDKGADDSRQVTFSDGSRAVVPMLRRVFAAGTIKTFELGPRGTYGGWVSTDPLADAHARLLVEFITKELGDVAWYTNPFDPHATVIHAVEGANDVTDAVALEGEFDASFSGWSQQHRRSVRKAEREGVSVRTGETLEDWKAYFGAYESSLERWGEDASRPYEWEMFERIAALPDSLARLWLSVIEGRVAAGAVCFYAKRHVVYWHGAAHSEYFKMRPVHLLFRHAIADACERGYRWFDFNPSGGLEGVREFKKGFNTREYACPTIRRDTLRSRLARRLRGR